MKTTIAPMLAVLLAGCTPSEPTRDKWLKEVKEKVDLEQTKEIHARTKSPTDAYRTVTLADHDKFIALHPKERIFVRLRVYPPYRWVYNPSTWKETDHAVTLNKHECGDVPGDAEYDTFWLIRSELGGALWDLLDEDGKRVRNFKVWFK